jgi:hypothetical protein
MRFLKPLYVALLTLASMSRNARAGDAAVIPLAYGSNLINFGADGEAGMAVLGHRDNGNAHGFDVLTLYLKRAHEGAWQIVSVFDGEKEQLTLTAAGGADCVLHDFRLIRTAPHDSAELVVADRDAGASFADAAPVRFKFYQLRRSSQGDVGRPLYFFELVRRTVSRTAHCDVGEAFSQELGIGAYAGAAAENAVGVVHAVNFARRG